MSRWCFAFSARSDGKILKQYDISRKTRDWEGICTQMKSMSPEDMDHLGIWAHSAELSLMATVLALLTFAVCMCVSGRMRKMCVNGLVAMGLRQAALRVGVSTDAVMRKARSGPSNDRDISIVERGASVSSSTERNPLTGSYNEVRC